MTRMQIRTWYIVLLVAVLCTLGTSAVPVPGQGLSQIRGTVPTIQVVGKGGEQLPITEHGVDNAFSGPPPEIDPTFLGKLGGCVVNFDIFNRLHS
jgi:hypothetical protein